jgi:hypothetical protein
MEAPDTEKGSVLPVHPGTLAYLNGDQVSLLDETLNYYWLVGMVFAGLTSCVGWLAAKAGFRRRDELLESQARLAELLREVKSASPGELAGLDEELGQMMDRFFMKLALGEIEAGQFQGIERVVSQLRATIEKRSTDHAAAQLPAERARTPALQA